jgi:hypothetical protein
LRNAVNAKTQKALRDKKLAEALFESSRTAYYMRLRRLNRIAARESANNTSEFGSGTPAAPARKYVMVAVAAPPKKSVQLMNQPNDVNAFTRKSPL